MGRGDSPARNDPSTDAEATEGVEAGVSQKAECQKCTRMVSADAKRCSHCGYDPENRLPVAVILIGVLMTITIIGAIIGVPMMLAGAYMMFTGDDPKPTEDELWYVDSN